MVDDPALETLFLALREKFPSEDEAAKDILFLRARYHQGLNQLKSKKLVCLQSDKGEAKRLRQKGFSVQQTTSDVFDFVLMLGSKDKEENLYHFGLALNGLKNGSSLLCSMPNSLGASRFERILKEATGNIEVLSKHKCRVFRARKRPGLDRGVISKWIDLGSYHQVEDSQLFAPVGVFSSKKIDKGSLLLAGQLPNNLEGRGADFGAGYGYLSQQLLLKNPNIAELHLYESEKLALEAAEKNLEMFKEKAALVFHWHDLLTEPTSNNFDWVISNPPFHNGGKASSTMGEKFIVSAAKALKQSGRLFLVANQHLAYERTLSAHFRVVKNLIRDSGYKVFSARK